VRVVGDLARRDEKPSTSPAWPASSVLLRTAPPCRSTLCCAGQTTPSQRVWAGGPILSWVLVAQAPAASFHTQFPAITGARSLTKCTRTTRPGHAPENRTPGARRVRAANAGLRLLHLGARSRLLDVITGVKRTRQMGSCNFFRSMRAAVRAAAGAEKAPQTRRGVVMPRSDAFKRAAIDLGSARRCRKADAARAADMRSGPVIAAARRRCVCARFSALAIPPGDKDRHRAHYRRPAVVMGPRVAMKVANHFSRPILGRDLRARASKSASFPGTNRIAKPQVAGGFQRWCPPVRRLASSRLPNKDPARRAATPAGPHIPSSSRLKGTTLPASSVRPRWVAGAQDRSAPAVSRLRPHI